MKTARERDRQAELVMKLADKLSPRVSKSSVRLPNENRINQSKMMAYKTLEVKLDTEQSMRHFKIDKPRKNFVNANIKKISVKHPIN